MIASEGVNAAGGRWARKSQRKPPKGKAGREDRAGFQRSLGGHRALSRFRVTSKLGGPD